MCEHWMHTYLSTTIYRTGVNTACTLSCWKLESILYNFLQKVLETSDPEDRENRKSRWVKVVQTHPSPGWGMEGVRDKAGAGHIRQHLLQRTWTPKSALCETSLLESENKECFWGAFHPVPNQFQWHKAMRHVADSALSEHTLLDSHAFLWRSTHQTFRSRVFLMTWCVHICMPCVISAPVLYAVNKAGWPACLSQDFSSISVLGTKRKGSDSIFDEETGPHPHCSS